MPDIWMDVDIALAEVPVNVMPLLDDSDFKTREVAVAYNAAGMDLVWNFVTSGGAFTQTAVTPTTGGTYDWTHQGDGIYTIEIPASGGASINNDTEGHGWFSGIATGVLPWRGPVIGFRAAAVNDALVDGNGLLTAADVADAVRTELTPELNDVAQTANDATAIKAVTDLLPDGGALTTIDANIDAILVDTAEIGTAGAGLTNINLPNQTMDIVGNITGNLSGSVGSVTGAVGSVTGNVGGNVTGSVGDSSGVTTLLSRLTGTRAGYLDSLNAPALPSGAVVADGGNSATAFVTDRSETTTDYWKDALLLITSGVLTGQVKKVTAYNGSTKAVAVESGFTGTPATGVTFLLVNS